MQNPLKRLSNWVAVRSDIYREAVEDHDSTCAALAEQTKKLLREINLRLATEKGYWALVRELKKHRFGIAEWNHQGKYLPKTPMPLRAEGAPTALADFGNVGLETPLSRAEIGTLYQVFTDGE